MTQARSNAIVTATYAPDFDRCRILCETIDRYATGFSTHYLLVDKPDVPLFRQLAGPRRVLVTDAEILPWWMRRFPDVTRGMKRRVWLSPYTKPLHGWHVQQIMRIAIAGMIPDDGLLYCDSDTALVRPYDLSTMWQGDRVRMFREEHGALHAESDHLIWRDHATRAFGITEARRSDHNYVCSFVTWKRQTVLDMCAAMERVNGRHWISVVGSTRKFSECMLYGAYVDDVLGGEGHFIDNETLCPMQWFAPPPTPEELRAFVTGLSPREVGLGVQSFIPVDSRVFRAALGV